MTNTPPPPLVPAAAAAPAQNAGGVELVTENNKPSGPANAAEAENKSNPFDQVVIKVESTIQIKERLQNVRHARDYYKPGPGRVLMVLRPGQVFFSVEKLRATGLTSEDIEQLQKEGHLRFTTVASALTVREDLKAPLVLGNSLGGKDADAALREIRQNRPDSPFGWNPANLSTMPIDTLRTMLHSRAPQLRVQDMDQTQLISHLSRDY